MSITMSGLFKLMERINMHFPKGKGKLDDKVRFEERVNFILSKPDSDEADIKGR